MNFSRALLLVLAPWLAACGHTARAQQPAPSSTGIIVLGGVERLRPGATLDARVFVRGPRDAAFRDVTDHAVWSIEPRAIASIDPHGHLIAQRAGHATVVANADGTHARTDLEIVDALPADAVPHVSAHAPLVVRRASLDIGVDGRVRLAIDTLDDSITAVGYRHDDALPLRVPVIPTARSRSRGLDPAMAGGAIVIDAEHDGLAFGRAMVPYRGVLADLDFVLPLAAHPELSDDLKPRPPLLLARRVAARVTDASTGIDVALHVDATAATDESDHWVYLALGMYPPADARTDRWRAMGRIAQRPLAPLGVHRRDSEQAFAVLLEGGGATIHGWDLTARLGDDAVAGSEIPMTFEVSFHVPPGRGHAGVTLKRADLAPLGVTNDTDLELEIVSTSQHRPLVAGGWSLGAPDAAGRMAATARGPRVDGFSVRFEPR